MNTTHFHPDFIPGEYKISAYVRKHRFETFSTKLGLEEELVGSSIICKNCYASSSYRRRKYFVIGEFILEPSEHYPKFYTYIEFSNIRERTGQVERYSSVRHIRQKYRTAEQEASNNEHQQRV